MKARKPEQLSHRRARYSVRVLPALLFAVALVGCGEGAQSCFPLGTDCSDAAGFSEFFESDVPCCEGACTPQPPDPERPNVIPLACELP